MKFLNQLKNPLADAAAYLFVLLFVYAAVSKLLEFEDFQIQLAQSPLLSAYARLVAPVIIAIELITAILLSFSVTRLVGLYLSFSLVVGFTIYIYLILNYSEFIPCSCGGILEDMGWTEHLVFNLGFILLGGWALWIMENKRTKGFRRILTRGIVSFVFSTGIVIGLFFSSEHIIKKENPFVRRFIPHAITLEKYYDLKFNSYYFAGYDNGQIYLGNYTAPLVLTVIDTAFDSLIVDTLQLDNKFHSFKAIEIKIKPPYYYVADGNVPVIFREKLGKNQLKEISYNDAYFPKLEPIDSVNFIFRTQGTNNNQNQLGVLNLLQPSKVNIHQEFLQSPNDGIFDTDGQLIQDQVQNHFIYIPYYKNEVLVFDADLNLINKFHTIDSISQPQINIAAQKNGIRKFIAPPVTVNRLSIASNNNLFNLSNLKGKYESDDIWKSADVIDLYRVDKQDYLGSFFIEHQGKKRMSDMLAADKYIFVLSGNELLRYRFAQTVMVKFRMGEAENP